MTDPKLPELPEPDCSTDDAQHGAGKPAYTLETLRAYGDEREAYGRATAPAEVGDGRSADYIRGWNDRAYRMQAEVAEALADATRPAVPDGFGADFIRSIEP